MPRPHLHQHRGVRLLVRGGSRQDPRSGRLHDGPRESDHGPQLQIFHFERGVDARNHRRAGRYPHPLRERHPRTLLCGVQLRQGEGRERHALPASGPRYRHRHRHGGQTLLRQERLRGRIRPHPFFDNEKICACGKKGCLETEVSGIAIEEKICSLIEKGVNTILREKYDRKEPIHIDDIIAAAKNDDNLSIELIEGGGREDRQGRRLSHQHLQPRDGDRRRQHGRSGRLHHAAVEVLDQQVFAQPSSTRIRSSASRNSTRTPMHGAWRC